MTDDAMERKRLQWKWVWITLGMLVLFYIVPITGASAFKGQIAQKIIGAWAFGGVILISAVAGFLSKGVTIWEPAIAGGLLAILLYGVFLFITATKGLPIRLDVSSMIVGVIAIFGLSLIGAGLGEGIQNVRRQIKNNDETVKSS